MHASDVALVTAKDGVSKGTITTRRNLRSDYGFLRVLHRVVAFLVRDFLLLFLVLVGGFFFLFLRLFAVLLRFRVYLGLFRRVIRPLRNRNA